MTDPAPKDAGHDHGGMSLRELMKLPTDKLIILGVLTMLGLDGYTRQDLTVELRSMKTTVEEIARSLAVWSTKQEDLGRNLDRVEHQSLKEREELRRRLEVIEARIFRKP